MIYRKSFHVMLWLGLLSPNIYGEDFAYLLDLDIDSISMLDVNFESANKNPQKLSDIPSSVYVLSNERIMRSGYQSIAQIMSLVPGFYASKYDENGWMVSTRGFHDSLYNKILVMVNGRSVYSPIYGGVYWTDLDYLLADIDHIEVLRGPGGTMWGANAANGVVNIITKSAQDTLGTLLSASFGEYGYYNASLRQGVEFSSTEFAKVFYKHKRSPNTLNSDASHRESDQIELTFEKYFENQTLVIRTGGEQSGDHFDVADVSYWDDGNGWYYSTVDEYERKIDSHSYFMQLIHQYVQTDGNVFNSMAVFQEDKDQDPFAPGKYRTADFDINYLYSATSQTEIFAGIGFSYIELRFDYGPQDYSWQSNPDIMRAAHDQKINDVNTNIYIQAETWWNEKFKTILGVKGEYFSQNETFEISPQLRALYQLNENHSFWGGIARAVMLPSYLDTDSEYTYHEEWGGIVEPTTFLANPNLDNESVITAELGYRYTPSHDLDFDITAFFSEYKNLRGVHTLGYGADLGYQDNEFYYYSYLLGIDDDYSAQSYGVELSSHYNAADNLALYLSYAYLHLDSDWQGGEYSDGSQESVFNVDLQQNVSLQLLWTISTQWQWDFVVKYLDQEVDANAKEYGFDFDPFISFDTRLAWQYKENMPLFEMMLQTIGHDELQDSWVEYKNEQLVSARVSYQF